jgi:excisionase family DNA binding protein
MLPDPEETPTISVEKAGEYLGMSKAAAYRAAARGEIPTIRCGRLLVPVAEFRRRLGFVAPTPAEVVELRPVSDDPSGYG